MKLKNKKGFTLIELLAVIVVLAIIALIATPIVMNTIKNAKKGAAERTADNYIKQVETAVAEAKLENKSVPNGTYDIDGNGNLLVPSLPNGKLEIEMSGNKPTSGKVTISNGGVSQDGTSMIIGDYNVAYSDNKYAATKVETYKITYNLTNVSGNNVTSITSVETKSLTFTANVGYQLPESVTVSGATSVWDKKTGILILSKASGNVTITVSGEKIKTYSNGETVYFNVTTGEKCSSSDYTETQSNVGTKTGCMKFYNFNDDGGETVNLLLDHNTTAKFVWNSSKNNANGPSELLTQLKNDTESWQGTITPSNYTMDQAGQTSNAKYTIDYSSYKARLITAQEIATIIGNTSWNEKTANSYYYLDSKKGIASSTCTSGNTSGCKYGWLYDRTSEGCTTRGCLNNSDRQTYGYWTISSRADYVNRAWFVRYDAYVDGGLVNDSTNYGIRPVIEVLKSNLN